MNISFSNAPGARERHLRRKHLNPLFTDANSVTSESVRKARSEDRADFEAFERDFPKLIEEAVALPGLAESDLILSLKERLDKTYEQTWALPGDQSRPREAIKKLLAVIMQAVRRGAAGDPQAHRELEQEELARETHFALLEYPVIADLLNPKSPVAAHELAPTLLSETDAALEAALTLFDETQIRLLCQESRALLAWCAKQNTPAPDAEARLETMERALARISRFGGQSLDIRE